MKMRLRSGSFSQLGLAYRKPSSDFTQGTNSWENTKAVAWWDLLLWAGCNDWKFSEFHNFTGNSDPPPGHHPSLLPEPPSPLLYTKKDLQRWRKGFAAPRATKEQLCQVPKVLPHSQPCSSPSHTEFPQCWWLKGSPILHQRNHFIEQVLGSFLSCWSYHGSVSIWSFSIPYVLNNCISTPADIWLLQFICKHD